MVNKDEYKNLLRSQPELQSNTDWTFFMAHSVHVYYIVPVQGTEFDCKSVITAGHIHGAIELPNSFIYVDSLCYFV